MKIHVEIDNGYDIVIGNNILENLTDYCKLPSKVLIITDDNIPLVYQNILSKNIKSCYTYSIAPGEKSKTLQVYENILHVMLEEEFSRKDMVIALGGGVVGDLAGFVAATYKRGCRFINIPTSTLSMVDSSIGGKVAVNLDNIKNIIGTFYQPELVLIDLDTLNSLPKRQYYNGLVEALKMGLIMDPALVKMFDDIANNLDKIIYHSLMAKKQIVEADVREEGIRKILNFGHTIGHGIESVNLGEIFHGEAVAYGMVLMIENEKLKNEVLQILYTMNIIPKYDKIEEVYKALMQDKKRNDNNISIIKVSEIGKWKMEEIAIEKLYLILKGAK